MYLLDTNVVIDFCNAKLPITAKQLFSDIEPKISVITHIEIFSSAKTNEKENLALQDFIQFATVYNHLDLDVVEETIQIRQLYKTKLPDAIIAATALVNNCTLVSRNISDFKNIAGLKVIDPYNL